ncbi:MAG TPA: pyridoxamine 5'-phosphate oxidase family protein [Actinomycetota bacterium]|nr:pyridoxamine 5'-phosphate oxidase family protein [Actinomycetota bacterium]
MSTPPTWTRAEILDRAEAMHLLESARWGRCAWSTPAGPRILPINYSVLDAAIYFRTGLNGSLADVATGSTVALETDELDDRMTSAWSVVVLGVAEQVTDPDEIASLFARIRDPWAPESRPVLVRIVPTEVTGRRFHKQ